MQLGLVSIFSVSQDPLNYCSHSLIISWLSFAENVLSEKKQNSGLN